MILNSLNFNENLCKLILWQAIQSSFPAIWLPKSII